MSLCQDNLNLGNILTVDMTSQSRVTLANINWLVQLYIITSQMKCLK